MLRDVSFWTYRSPNQGQGEGIEKLIIQIKFPIANFCDGFFCRNILVINDTKILAQIHGFDDMLYAISPTIENS